MGNPSALLPLPAELSISRSSAFPREAWGPSQSTLCWSKQSGYPGCSAQQVRSLQRARLFVSLAGEQRVPCLSAPAKRAGGIRTKAQGAWFTSPPSHSQVHKGISGSLPPLWLSYQREQSFPLLSALKRTE